MTDRIQDNPTSKSLMNDLGRFKALSDLVGWLEKVGIRNEKIPEAIREFPQLYAQAQQLVKMPDEFNTHFSKAGWIAYESFNAETMKSAIELANAGRIDEAEKLLVEHFLTEDAVKFPLVRLCAHPKFQARRQLAELALEDHLNRRFHASVPLVLTLIDGFVNDVVPTGFFSENADLTAWDSIAGHSSGLLELKSVFTKHRGRTTDNEILVPYRNGILHGRDLGFANANVSAKCWATLFAVSDWARALENQSLETSPEKADPTLWESIKLLAANDKRKKVLDRWRPRIIAIGDDIPVCAAPSEYREGSPERAAVEFLDAWKSRNFGRMAESLDVFHKQPKSQRAGELRSTIGEFELNSFELVGIEDQAAAITEVAFQVNTTRGCKTGEDRVTLRLVHLEENDPIPYPAETGLWKIVSSPVAQLLQE
jgi:hypothetical protein